MDDQPIILDVTTTEDQNDGSSFEGLALRDAILIANADPSNQYQINLPAGTYNLTIQNTLQPSTDSSADSNTLFNSRLATGDLDVIGNIVIVGEDPANTIINAGGDPDTGNVGDGTDPFPTPDPGQDDADADTPGVILGDRVFDVLQANSPAGNEDAGILVLQKVTIQGGISSGDNIDTIAQGGGLNIETGAQALIIDSIVRDNNSSDNAGGIYNQGSLTIYGSAIIDNLADAGAPDIIEGGGGGVLNESGADLTIINSTISGNRSASNNGPDDVGDDGLPIGPGDGGGGVLSRGFTRIINSTIVGNYAQIGSGIYSETTTANTIIYNTIVADNIGSPDIDGFFSDESSFNLITNGNGAILDGINGNIVGGVTTVLGDTPGLTDLFIGPLADNGGLTPTHALLAGSPAIDAGDFSEQNILFYFTDIPELEPFLGDTALDQRGSERISNGAIDIGAYEVFVENTSADIAQATNSPSTDNPNSDLGVNPPTTNPTPTDDGVGDDNPNSDLGVNPPTTNPTPTDDGIGEDNLDNSGGDLGVNPPSSDESIDIPDAAEVLNEDASSDSVPVLDDPLFRFRNEDVQGTYLYVTQGEADTIRQDFSPPFIEEGNAFNVSLEQDDDLVRINRFRNNQVQGTYLYATEAESVAIRQNFSNEFTEEGTAFYTFGADDNLGTDVIRFQNKNVAGTYIFVLAQEADTIRQNFSNVFEEEGVAFEVA